MGTLDVYATIRAGILALEFVPGESLTERGLEERYGVSRTPIRAALLRLQADGLIRRLDRQWQVTPIDLTEIRAVMEYREAIETAAAALAIERADDSELEGLSALAHAPDAEDSDAAMLREGGDFHLALTQLSANPFLADGMRDALTRLTRTRWLEVRTAESRAHARGEHIAISAAIGARDADRARRLIVAHSRGTRDRLLAHLTEERRRLRGRGFAIVESAPE